MRPSTGTARSCHRGNHGPLHLTGHRTPPTRQDHVRRSLALLFAVVVLVVSSLTPPERERIALGADLYGASANGRRLLIEVST